MNSGTRRLTVILGAIMIIAMGSSVILPILNPGRNLNTQPTEAATDIPTPTVPAPPTDLSVIGFDHTIVHPTGMFSLAQPTGWLPMAAVTTSTGGTPTAPEINLNNSDRLSVIQAVLQPANDMTTLEQVDTYYTPEVLQSSWQAYSTWRETARRQEDNKLIMDFELKNRRDQTFIARQESWVEDGWLYRLRVITPENAPEMLKYLMENLIPSFKVNPVLAAVPLDWKGYFESGSNMAIRFPADWTLTDSALGRMASFSGSGATLRLEAQPNTGAADEAAARQWVEAARPGAEVVSVQPATRGDLSGFSVAYTYTDADGNPHSGFAVLLNGTDGTLYSANLRFDQAGVDLNAPEGRDAAGDLATVMDTFTVLSGVEVLLPTPTPSPTPLASPTPAPTAEATADATEAATAEATAGS
ncbi:MAG: hypothetical protein HZC41_08910 [Chloroflexi bacterium]|nr:hypothetical protein [Chloroflexota bacterium]